MNHVSFYRKGYPRPQMVRESWVDLNGVWSFRFDEENSGKQLGLQNGFEGGLQITVPFSYQTKASGICDGRQCDRVWYSRKFHFERCGKRFLLHFDGADYRTEVYVNGCLTGVHEGAYTRFSFDVTDFCKPGENVLTVRCEDTRSMEQPRGKQRWRKENFTCWYEETSGIWKSVWGEYVNEERILSLTSSFGADEQSVDLCGECSQGEYDLRIRIRQSDEIVSECTYKIGGGSFSVNQKMLSYLPEPSGIRYWYPYSPFLYETEIELLQDGQVKDRVQSYFAAVRFRISDGAVVLNKSRFYPRMILNQGYYADSGLTPKSDDDMVNDLSLLSALGFNGARIPDNLQTIADKAFSGCRNLVSVTIGSSVTSVGDEAFLACYKLLEVYNKSALSLEAGSQDHGYLAYYAKNVYTKEGASWYVDTEEGYRFLYDGSKGYLMGYYGTETALTLPTSFSTYYNTTVTEYEIHPYAFYRRGELTSVTIPDNVTGIGDYAFYDCDGLTGVTIGSSVTYIGNYAFDYCYGLTNIAIPDNVTSIGNYAFAYCRALNRVDLGNGVQSIGNNAFYDCSDLTNITISAST